MLWWIVCGVIVKCVVRLLMVMKLLCCIYLSNFCWCVLRVRWGFWVMV